MSSFFVRINNQQAGPLSKEQLEEKMRLGEITKETFCWFKGQEGWKPMGEALPSLFLPAASPQQFTPQSSASSARYQSPPHQSPPPGYVPQQEVQPVISAEVPIPLAPNALRFGGMMIDSLILCIPAWIAALIIPAVGSLVVAWAYTALLTSSSMRGTVGMKMFGIQVVNPQGQTLSLGVATGRYFASLLSFFCLGIGYLMVFFSSKRQTLHDQMANTYVVKI